MISKSPPRTAAPPILGRQMVMLLVAAFGALCGFYLLLSVVPLYAADSGGGEYGAGLATGATMLSTVLIELAVPRLLARLGYRAVMGLGLLLLGAPAIALVASPATVLVLGVSLVRGAGLGIVVVVGSALAAELVPPRRRAEGLALYGVVVCVPAIVGLPAGIWLSEHVGFAPVFVAAAAVALLPLAAVPALPARSGGEVRPGSVLDAFRAGGLARPAVIFTAVTFAAGVFATFLPLAVPAETRGVAAVALLVQALTMSAARFAAGRFGDRHGSGPLLIPAVLASAAGAALLMWVDSPLAMIAGMALFGAGFGAAQNVTLTLMIERVGAAEYGRTSALWNVAYDAGFGIGAVGFGLVVGPVGYVTGFVLTAAVLLTALVPAILDRRKADLD
ncbi:MAG: MFS transporter [Actinophytocola sp.]|uniref:MFS transporter n=1 Tax=Actinophytocola sp. TaxID=1872138 RepID=UPI0013278C60|nr:MFS transporter [Actinophytocola sp.]MPZ84872.1 MFS transporter [Actinophytocola sp.]